MTHPILPSQFLLQPKPDAFLPAKRLMVAVLTAAMNEYEHYVAAKNPLGRRRFAEVEGWFASDDTRWPFSFVAICGALDLDVASIRAGLRTCRAQPTRVWLHCFVANAVGADAGTRAAPRR